MLIAFTAKMGAGKSTAVDYLRATFSGEHHFTPVLNVKFAQPLYDMQEYIYGRVSSVHKLPEDFVKDRKLLQWLGTEWGRSLSETIWVDLWKARVKSLMVDSPRSIIVCDDVRFDNEADAVHALGGSVVRITSDNTKDRIDTTSGIKQHSSETGINPKLVDYEVFNNGTIREFQLAIRNVYGLIEHKERYL